VVPEIINERVCAEVEDGVVVFLIGVRFNRRTNRCRGVVLSARDILRQVMTKVLRLAALAIQRVVQPLRAAAPDVGHDVADVQSVAARLDARADAPLAFPGFGAVACLGVAPHQRCLALGVAHPHIVGDLLDLPIQHVVAAEAEDIVNAVGLAPRLASCRP